MVLLHCLHSTVDTDNDGTTDNNVTLPLVSRVAYAVYIDNGTTETQQTGTDYTARFITFTTAPAQLKL